METTSLIGDGLEPSAGEALPATAQGGEETVWTLLRLAGVGVWSVPHGSAAPRWDFGMHSLFGLDLGAFSERKEDFFDLVHQEDRDRVRREFSDALNQGAQFATEYRVVWQRDGSAHKLRSRGQICEHETGGACRMAGICWDVTKPKEKEREHALERHLMSFLMENSPDKIYFKDISGRFIRISRAMRDWFGEDEEDAIVGKTDFGFFTEEHARQAFEDEHAVISTGVPIFHKEVMEKWRDGRTTWISATKMPLRDVEGRIVGTFGISIDITKQKRVEASLLEQLERLRVRNAELEEALKKA